MSTQVFTDQLISAKGGLDQLDGCLIVHVSTPDAFAAAHIPGATLLTPADLTLGLPPAPGKLPPPERLAEALQRIGYAADRKLVVYDDEGGGWAGRFIWTLDVIGHTNWQYLDGGLHAWAAAGNDLASGQPSSVAATEQAAVISYNPQLVADVEELIGAVTREDPELVIWDARSAAEHLGERSGSPRAGRIPGSAHLDWLDVMDRDNHLCLRRDLATLLSERGITPDKRVVVHCQTHHRSGLAYLAARLLGYPTLQGYDGSWAEWGNRTDTPVVTGRP